MDIVWTDLRTDMIKHLIQGKHDITSAAEQLTTQVNKFQFHPLTIEDIKDAMPTSNQKTSILSFSYDDPIPDLPEAPLRSNKWRITIYFHYTKKKTFKLIIQKTNQSVSGSTFSYSTVDESITTVRKDTSKEDLQSNQFLYYLRDLIGVNLKRIKEVALCESLVYIHDYSYQLLCGNGVKVKGADCYYCRGRKLKRKFKDV